MVILIVYWISDSTFLDWKNFFENALFINCQGHLWYLQQEMLCYLFAPILMLVVYIIKKNIQISNNFIGIGFIIIGLITNYYFSSISDFYLMGNGQPQFFRFGLFIIGIGFGYFIKKEKFFEIVQKSIMNILDIIEMIVLLLFVFSAANYLGMINHQYINYYIGWEKPLLCAFVIGILLVLLTINRKGMVSKFLSHPILVRFGKASFGIYIMHFFMLPFLGFSSELKNFFVALVFSMCLSLVSFEMFEEPLLNYYKSKKVKDTIL